MERLKRLWLKLRAPSGLTGACLAVALLPQEPGLPVRILSLLIGWGYGRLIGLFLRFFRVVPGAFPLVGLIAAPAPAALCFSLPTEERGAVLAATAVLGLVVGTVEWAHQRWLDRLPGEGA